MSTATRNQSAPQIQTSEVDARVRRALNRWPCVGLAVAVVRNGSLEYFHGHGLADVASRTPVTVDTVFRIGSITKTFTAIAVLQLSEQGLVDLDAPAREYVRAYPVIPAGPGRRPATVRQLLTHTSGIPDVIHVADLLHPGWGPLGARPPLHSVPAGEALPSLAEYYRGGLRQVVEPGTAFAYSNHGFATLGQLVEDVSGVPIVRYLAEHVFAPLGMTDTSLVRSERLAARLAVGYVLRRGGVAAVPDREWVGTAGGGVYSTTRDMAHYVAALLRGGGNEHGSVLKPATLANMFETHYQADPRLPGMGLGFFRSDAGGHRVTGHDGILPGFHSGMLLAPDAGVGVIAFTNGSSGAMVWLPIELRRLLHLLLGVAEEKVRDDVPHRPEVWADLCGRYRLPPRISDLRGRVTMGRGVEVFVRGGRLWLRVLTPVPALYRGFPLHADDDTDPYVFRLDLSSLGMSMVRLAFERAGEAGARAVHTDLGGQPLSLHRVPRRGGKNGARHVRDAGPAPLV
jgi:CubicO group peptidase (beta-lactamase class C family)